MVTRALGSVKPIQPTATTSFLSFSRGMNRPGLALVLAFLALTAVWLRRGAPASSRQLSFRPEFAVLLCALLTFAGGVLGNEFVFHHYALTADENMANFQAQIFLQGHLRAVIPPFWEPMIRIIAPTHVAYFPALHSWNSSYLPVYAALRALFMSAGLQVLLNPLCAAVSVIMVAAVTRKLWPDDPWKPAIAAALLASSSQVLVMSMTAYAMPAHLALNLIWLWLYLHPAKRRFWLTPFVGVAALALHQLSFTRSSLLLFSSVSCSRDAGRRAHSSPASIWPASRDASFGGITFSLPSITVRPVSSPCIASPGSSSLSTYPYSSAGWLSRCLFWQRWALRAGERPLLSCAMRR